MKRLVLIILLALSFSNGNNITISELHENVLNFSESTLDTLDSNDLNLYLNQYINIADWNNDGLKDIIVSIAKDQLITTYLALFLAEIEGNNITYNEAGNYLMNARGETADFGSTVGDINEDGLLDIVIVTENYHGPEGQQPSYYLGGQFTTDKLFINNGQGFNSFELDTTMRYLNGIWQYWGSNAGQIFDWDFDGDLEILISDNNYARIREGSNPVQNKLFASFDINSTDSISREFVFDWPLGEWLSEQWIHTDLRLFKTINDTLYLAHYNIVGWDTLDSVFVDPSLIDNNRYIRETQYEILVFAISESFGINSLIDTVSLINEKRGGFVVENGFGVSDIDNDGKMEFLTYWWHETNQLKENYIRIFDDDGVDITEQLMPIEWFDDPRTGGSGFTIIDLNNDGFDDILPRNGWAQMNEQGRITSYGIFLNDNGNRYVLYNVDFLSCLEIECGPFNHPIDINNDGKYEILNILHNPQDIANIDITMLDYNFIIGSPTFDIEYTDQMMNEDDTLFVILLASDVDQDSLTFTAESNISQVQTIVVDNMLTVIPDLNWYGDVIIHLVVSDNGIDPLSDSTSFNILVNPINDAPSSFALNEQDSVYITMDNFASDSIVFTWGESTDIDGDELLYDFTASLKVNGQVKAEYSSSSLTDREMKIDYQSVFDEIFAAQAMVGGIEWDVSVTDGVAEVTSGNGALTLGVNASAAVLSINGELLPEVFALHQNYPNPFNPVTTLRYDLPENGHVNIIIYDMLGKQVKTLVNKAQDAGYKSVIWDATNDYGKPVSAGIYLYQIQAGEYISTKKMVLLK
jgi:hypothetical protein